MVKKIILPDTFSGFEVYKTVNNPKIENDNESSNNKLVAMNGTIKEIAYYDNMYDNSFDEDYESISNTASVSFPEIDEKRFYKGKKVCLKKLNKIGSAKWKELITCFIGFISEQTFDTESVDVKLVGMSKLLDQSKEFSFKKTKRSKILKEIITSAGLKADIDVTGLKDDVIDYTNVSSSGSSSSGGYSGSVSADIAEASNQICEGLTTELEKAKAIWKWCHDNLKYVGYSNSQRGAKGCFKQRGGNCCDHANVVVQMLKAQNIKCAYEHSGSCYGGKGHVWAVAYCEGKWYRIDASVKSRSFNQVGQGCTGERLEKLNF
ncbi:MAG: hypothetical protein J6M08_04220 [Methanobrevibacter sp.]|nr:hypothetical protein [Methanobrevibacter sp.]